MPFAAAGAGLGAIGSIVGGGKQAKAAKQAAQIQADAANKATDLQREQFNTIQSNETPFRQAGQSALGTLSADLPSLTQGFDPNSAGLPSQFHYDASSMQDDPAFQFAMQQGQQAIERSAAARGGVLGGGTQKDLQTFAQGTANQFYGQDYARAQDTYNKNYGNAFNTFTSNQNNAFNKLAGVTEIGANATGQVNNAASKFGDQAGANTIAAGNSMSAGVMGAANAQASEFGGLSSSLQGLLNNSKFQTATKNFVSSYRDNGVKGDG